MLKRELYLQKIRPFYDSDLIKVLIGIRRCGKSVILKQIISEIKGKGIDEDHIIYINFEDLEYAGIKNEMDLHQYVKTGIKDDNKYYLFFDEIQNVLNFEKAINSFRATFNTSIFITGSNGRLLSGELATELSGRYVSFPIMPFSFREMCEYKGIDNADDTVLLEYVKWGGMPQRFSFGTEEETKVYLTDLYNSIVLRDIVQKSKIKEIDLLNRIVEYLVTNNSQLFSAKSISGFMKSENRELAKETLYNYLSYIVSSFIMTKAQRYDLKGKKVLSTLEKYYLTDTGIGRVKDSAAHVNIGAALENIVYNELLIRGYQVYIGKTLKGVVDFVATKMGEKQYVQVAYLLADETIVKREFGAFDEIKDNFPKYVLSMDKIDFSQNGIIHRNILEFLLEK